MFDKLYAYISEMNGEQDARFFTDWLMEIVEEEF